MSLTASQLSTVKALIAADSNLNSQPNNSDGNSVIADALNQTASPDFWVWHTFVSDTDIYGTTTADGTTWSWTIFIGRSQGERDAWREMVNMAGGLNPSLASVRAGIADIFSGSGGANQRTHLLTMGRRKATIVEKAFATGTGSTASPAFSAYDDNFALTFDDVTMARNS